MGMIHRSEGDAVPLHVFMVNPLYEDTHVHDVVAELEERVMREHSSDIRR
jgi:hypothetical protein